MQPVCARSFEPFVTAMSACSTNAPIWPMPGAKISYWQKSWKAGGIDEDFIVSTSLAKLKAAKQIALETMTAQNVELSVMDGNKLHWMELHIDCDRDTDGNLLGLVTTALEISELKRREQVLKTLLREVSHRSKTCWPSCRALPARRRVSPIRSMIFC